MPGISESKIVGSINHGAIDQILTVADALNASFARQISDRVVNFLVSCWDAVARRSVSAAVSPGLNFAGRKRYSPAPDQSDQIPWRTATARTAANGAP